MLPTTGNWKGIIPSDSVTPIHRVQDVKLGPGQQMAKNTVEWNNKIVGMGVEIEHQWVPSHEGDEGNETANQQVKAAVERVEGLLELVKGYKEWLMAKVQRRVTEAKWSETKKWWKGKFNGKKGRVQNE
jgi:hypothetical protein